MLERARDFYDDFGWPIERVRLHAQPFEDAAQSQRLSRYLAERNISEVTVMHSIWQKAIGCHGEALTRGRSGTVLHFQRQVEQGFLDRIDRRCSVTLEELQARFDEWLTDYNVGAELLGYPTMGKSPLQMIKMAGAAIAMLATNGVS